MGCRDSHIFDMRAPGDGRDGGGGSWLQVAQRVELQQIRHGQLHDELIPPLKAVLQVALSESTFASPG